MSPSRRYIMLGALVLSIILLMLTTVPPAPAPVRDLPVAFLQADETWADSVLQTLSVEEKLGQLIILSAPRNPQRAKEGDSLLQVLTAYRLGGILLGDYDVNQLARRVALYQQGSRLPLLMGLLPSGYQQGLLQLPVGLGLGAMPQDSFLQQVGDRMARQAHDLGIQLVMLPSLQSAYQADNYGELTERVNVLVRRFQQQQVMACVGPVSPYVPAIGDTSRFDSLLRPYQALVQPGPASWVLGRRPDARYQGYPAPISALASDRLSYEGLILGQVPADSRNMTGSLRQMFGQGVEILIADKPQLPAVIKGLSALLRSKELNEDILDQRVKRLLLAKTWTDARRRPYADSALVASYSRSQITRSEQFDTYLRSLSVLRNANDALPIGRLDRGGIHLLSLTDPLPHLLGQLRMYGPVNRSVLSYLTEDTLPELPLSRLRGYSHVLFALTQESSEQLSAPTFANSLETLAKKTHVVVLNFGSPQRLAVLPPNVTLIQAYEADSLTQTLVGQLVMGGLNGVGQLPMTLNPELPTGLGLSIPPTRLSYGPPQQKGLNVDVLKRMDTIAWSAITDLATPGCQVLVAYQGQVVWNKAYGYHTYTRRRPVQLTDVYDIASMTKVAGTTIAAMGMIEKERMGLQDSLGKFFQDDFVWIDSALRRDTILILPDTRSDEEDSILAVLAALHTDVDTAESPVPVAIPTPQLPVLRVSQTRGQDGPSRIPYVTDSIYLGDTLMLVRTWSLGRKRIRSRVFDVPMGDLLTHHSGLSAAMPVLPYLRYRRRGRPRFGRYFQPRADSMYSVAVADHFYLRRDFLDSLWQDAKRMRVAPIKKYQYSDANMVLVQQAIDSLNGFSIDSFLRTNFYRPLGLQQTGYLPLNRMEKRRIVPTQNDQRWRYQLLQGYVHDETAALYGGVAGNAGLFANASDLSHLFQMLLNGGTYGGHRYVSQRLVNEFTTRQAGHRGYGFDLPPRNSPYIVGHLSSKECYGHLGYTGTCVWVDPVNEVVFIFLSNRVHPTNRWRLNELEVRQRLHNVIYEAIGAN